MVIIGGHKRRAVGPRKVAVRDHDGNASSVGLGGGRCERHLVEGHQDDPVHTADDEVLHDLNLGRAIVLPDRTLPEHLDAQLQGSRLGARVHRLPELVRRSLGNDRDLKLAAVVALAACAEENGQRNGEKSGGPDGSAEGGRSSHVQQSTSRRRPPVRTMP